MLTCSVAGAMSEKEEVDLYSVLGASSCDSVQLLKHKYQQLVLQVNTEVSHTRWGGAARGSWPVCVQYHPDRFRGGSSSEAESALKKFLEIDAAWRMLKDQKSRREYDLRLRGGCLLHQRGGSRGSRFHV